jgi:outer membrane receptor for ferrienterochelin and colicin
MGLAKNLTLGCAGQVHMAYERYQDPNLSIGGKVVDNYFTNTDVRIEPRLDVALREGMELGLGGELVQISGEGNSLAHEVKRTQIGMFFAGEARIISGVGVITDLSIFPAVRLDAISSMLPTWSPQIGLLLGFRETDIGVLTAVKFAFRSSLSRNFRVPTFNELYFVGGGGLGNSSLRPEKSMSFDVGSSVRFLLAGEHLAQATYFVNDMSDRIVWVAAGSGTVSPKNLRRVRSEGLESSYRWDLPDRFLSFQVAYTTASSRKVSADFLGDPTVGSQLVYIPQEMFTFSATGTLELSTAVVKEVGGTLGYSLSGYRYLTEDNTEFLPAHRLVNIGIRSRLALGGLTLWARMEVNNLLNEDYQVMRGYPMPLRSYRGTISIEY